MQVISHMNENGIQIRDYGALISDIVLLASDKLSPSTSRNVANSNEMDIVGNSTCEVQETSNDLIWVDPSSCCFAVYSKLNADKVLLQQSPLALAKALKV